MLYVFRISLFDPSPRLGNRSWLYSPPQIDSWNPYPVCKSQEVPHCARVPLLHHISRQSSRVDTVQHLQTHTPPLAVARPARDFSDNFDQRSYLSFKPPRAKKKNIANMPKRKRTVADTVQNKLEKYRIDIFRALSSAKVHERKRFSNKLHEPGITVAKKTRLEREYAALKVCNSTISITIFCIRKRIIN